MQTRKAFGRRRRRFRESDAPNESWHSGPSCKIVDQGEAMGGATPPPPTIFISTEFLLPPLKKLWRAITASIRWRRCHVSQGRRQEPLAPYGLVGPRKKRQQPPELEHVQHFKVSLQFLGIKPVEDFGRLLQESGLARLHE